jgi:DNA-binding MarR family transcriptional regulator
LTDGIEHVAGAHPAPEHGHPVHSKRAHEEAAREDAAHQDAAHEDAARQGTGHRRSAGTDSAPANDELAEAVLTILRISRVMERIDAGVSPQQYRMLKLIGGGGERSARLAEKLAVAKPTLTSTADSLVAAGLAVREAEPGDRRVVRLCLTPAGQAATERADAAYGAWFGSLLAHTGRGEQILSDLVMLGEAMTERRRARLAADAAEARQ